MVPVLIPPLAGTLVELGVAVDPVNKGLGTLSCVWVTAGPVRVATIGTVVGVVAEGFATVVVLRVLEVDVDVGVSLGVDEGVVEVGEGVSVVDVVVGIG